MAGSKRVRPRPGRGRQAAQPRRFDPLVHPVAITEHCVIGDQIRLPAAWCDMPGCGAAFADPAALGETDNRARAARAGWARDRFGRLICPACQQRDHQAPGGAARPGRMSPYTPAARQAVGALRGDRRPSATQLPEFVDGFRRDTGDSEQAKPVVWPPEPIAAATAQVVRNQS
jgi:hypothetical protein